MNGTTALTLSPVKMKTVMMDISGLLFIYLTPAISHLFSFPLYLLEPMRIMLVLTIAHTSRKNAFFIALTLPVFSFIISAHPAVLKSLLITGELFFNVWLFFYFSGKLKNILAAAAASIILSKIAYYSFKFVLIGTGLLQTELVSTPLILQVVMATIFSCYLYIAFRIKES